jgi:hypothetical protein
MRSMADIGAFCRRFQFHTFFLVYFGFFLFFLFLFFNRKLIFWENVTEGSLHEMGSGLSLGRAKADGVVERPVHEILKVTFAHSTCRVLPLFSSYRRVSHPRARRISGELASRTGCCRHKRQEAEDRFEYRVFPRHWEDGVAELQGTHPVRPTASHTELMLIRFVRTYDSIQIQLKESEQMLHRERKIRAKMIQRNNELLHQLRQPPSSRPFNGP